MLSPSGLAALCMVFLVTLAPAALLISAIVLASRSERTKYHQVAMLGGFSYPVALGMLMAITSLLRR